MSEADKYVIHHASTGMISLDYYSRSVEIIGE